MRKRDRKVTLDRYLSGRYHDADVIRFVEHEVDLAVRRAKRKWRLREINLIEIWGARKLRDKIVSDLRRLAAQHFKPWTETLALRYEHGEEGQP